MFECCGGKHYSDNPRAISEKMHEMFPDYKLVWGITSQSVREKDYIPEYVETFPINSLHYRSIRSRAFALVRSEVMTDDLSKRKGQMFIQTWHGDRGIKKILFDSLDARGLNHKLYNFYDYKLTDIFVIGSDYAEKRIKTAFKYTGEVLKKGCPRNDCLLDAKDNTSLKERIGIHSDEKTLLYAPTLRRNSKVIQGNINISETLKALSSSGEKWVCLVRAHPKSIGIETDDNSSVIDVTDYPDMADLLVITDFLITDYSSCAGDFIVTKKPLILVQFDRETYLKEDRTLNVDVEEAGFIIARSQDELNDIIRNTSIADYRQVAEKLCNKIAIIKDGKLIIDDNENLIISL